MDVWVFWVCLFGFFLVVVGCFVVGGGGCLLAF